MDKNNRSKLDLFAHEVLAWRKQGKSYRHYREAVEREAVEGGAWYKKISYRTVQAWLVRNHPELAEDRDTSSLDEHDEDNASSPAQEQAETVQAAPSPSAEDLIALRTALDELTQKYRNLQARSAAQEAEIITLTEQRPTLEVQPMPSLPVPVYSGSWEHDLPMLSGEPSDIAPASRHRVLRRMLALGVTVLLLTLGMLAFYTAFQETLTRAYAAVLRSPHMPFALLAFSMVIAGLGLGLRIKALVPALLALATYLLMLRNAHIPFIIALLLTVQVSKALINDR